jgi:hypothetical protein
MKVMKGGRDTLLEEGVQAVFQYAMTDDPAWLDKALAIDERLIERGKLRLVGGEERPPTPPEPPTPHPPA